MLKQSNIYSGENVLKIFKLIFLSFVFNFSLE